jgi:hypothetical protein
MKPVESFTGAIGKYETVMHSIIRSPKVESPNFGIYLDTIPLYKNSGPADPAAISDSGTPYGLPFDVRYIPRIEAVIDTPVTFICCIINVDKEGNMTGIDPDPGLFYFTVPENSDGTGKFYALKYCPDSRESPSHLISVHEFFQSEISAEFQRMLDINGENARKIFTGNNIPREIDIVSTVQMYLTGKTNDGTPLTPETILRQPLIPSSNIK